MAGYTVSRSLLDQTAGDAVISLREAFKKVNTLATFLANNPVEGGIDPLTIPQENGGYGYTEDEAYLLRITFEGFSSLDVTQLFAIGRKLTGLS